MSAGDPTGILCSTTFVIIYCFSSTIVTSWLSLIELNSCDKRIGNHKPDLRLIYLRFYCYRCSRKIEDLRIFHQCRRRAWIIRNQWPTFPSGDPHSWVHFYFLASFRKKNWFVVSFWIILQQQQLLLLLLIWLSAALSYQISNLDVLKALM